MNRRLKCASYYVTGPYHRSGVIGEKKLTRRFTGIVDDDCHGYPNGDLSANSATPAAEPAQFSSLLLLPVAIFYNDPFVIPFHDFLIMAAFGLIFAIASVTLAEEMKRIPVGEAALLSPLKIPLAPLIGWMLLAETPANTTFPGGTVILLAVLATQMKPASEYG